MPRRREVIKRNTPIDPKYHDEVIGKFINSIMRKGKKSVAEGVIYGALDIIESKYKENPLELFKKAMDNIKPRMEVKSRRVGGATYQVPVEVNPERRLALAIRWILLYSRQRGEKGMNEKLAAELMDASQGKGGSIKKRDDTHKMAEANKAFSHYRW